MAEVTGFRNNALPYPVYGAPWAATFPLLDADGDLVTGATTPDAEVSKNGDTFADCTNESVEIATSSGVYYLLLTGTEMTADIVTVIAKSATAGMKTTVLTFYPRKLVSLRAATAAGGAAGSITLDSSASAIDDYYNGCLVVGVLDSATEARIITDYTGSSKVAAVTPNWNTTPDSDDTFTVYLPEGRQVTQSDLIAFGGTGGTFSGGRPEVNTTHAAGTAWGSGAITAASIAADAITAAKVADGTIDAATFAAGAINAAAIATDAITAAKIAADAIGASELAADAATEIGTAVWATTTRLLTAGTNIALAKGTGVTGFNDLSAAQVNAEVDTALVDVRLDELLAADSDVDGAAPPTVGSVFHELMTKTAGSFTYDQTTDSLEAVRDRGDAAWITATGFSTLDAAGVRSAVGLASANLDTQLTDLPTNAELATALGTADDAVLAQVALVKTAADAILVDTAELQTDWADGGRLDLILDARASQTSVNTIDDFLDTEIAALPTAAGIADAVWDELTADHAGVGSTGVALAAAGGSGDPWSTALPGAYGAGTAGKIVGDNINATVSSRASQTSVDTIDDFLDTEVAAIKAKTDNLPSDPADASVVAGLIAAVETKVDTIDDFLDLEVAAIKAKTDSLPASPAAVGSAMTLTSGERTSIGTALLDLSDGIETGLTLRGAQRLQAAALAGKVSGAGTGTETFRNAVADAKARLTVTVDVDGNRSAITADST